MSLLFAVLASAAFAQVPVEKPAGVPEPTETAEPCRGDEYAEKLKAAKKSMAEAERKLHEASEGERAKLEESVKEQKKVIDQLTELVRRAKEQRAAAGSKPPSCPPGGEGSKVRPPQGTPSKESEKSGSPSSKFRSTADREGTWGSLPEKERVAILHQRSLIDEYPPEYQEILKEYYKALAEDHRD